MGITDLKVALPMSRGQGPIPHFSSGSGLFYDSKVQLSQSVHLPASVCLSVSLFHPKEPSRLLGLLYNRDGSPGLPGEPILLSVWFGETFRMHDTV